LNEMQVYKKLEQHPHILRMYHSGMTKEGLPYFATEIVQPVGYDLDKLKNQYKFAGLSVPLHLMARIINQLADALNHMHSESLIHRDLKIQNVLVNEDYHAKHGHLRSLRHN